MEVLNTIMQHRVNVGGIPGASYLIVEIINLLRNPEPTTPCDHLYKELERNGIYYDQEKEVIYIQHDHKQLRKLFQSAYRVPISRIEGTKNHERPRFRNGTRPRCVEMPLSIIFDI